MEKRFRKFIVSGRAEMVLLFITAVVFVTAMISIFFYPVMVAGVIGVIMVGIPAAEGLADYFRHVKHAEILHIAQDMGDRRLCQLVPVVVVADYTPASTEMTHRRPHRRTS